MRLTTRRGVVGAIVAAQLVTVLVIVLVSGRLSADAEADHSASLLDNAAAEAADHTRSLLAPAESVVAATADMVNGGSVEADSLGRVFVGTLRRTPQLSSVYVGAADGSFFIVSRQPEGFTVKAISVADGTRSVQLTHMDEMGSTTGSEATPDDPFDPRDQPWFRESSMDDAGTVQWTAPYVVASERPGVTASASATTSDGLLVVAGADVELKTLSAFLGDPRVAPSGGAVILDETDAVLARSDLSLVPDISSGSAAGIDAGGRAWTIRVYAPEGSLVGSLTEARRDERLLIIGVGLTSVLILAAFAIWATRSLSNLEHRATVDSLTGLLNRGTILDEGQRIAQEAGMYATIMIDLDHFKTINDTHGHTVGDEVIREIGTRISGTLQATDRAGRVGGEEFLVVTGATSAARAVDVATRILGAIRDTPITTSTGELSVTSSIGLSIARGPAELLRSLAVADTALLAAKNQGRDRLVSGGVVGAPTRN